MIIAALMLIPHVLADVQVGFGTPYVSVGNTIKSPGIYFDGGEIIGANDMLESFGDVSASGSGELDQCWVVHSNDDKNYAVSYASLDDSGAYSYSYVLTPGTTSAKVTGHVEATDAEGITFGGFAYNGKAFAAVALHGDSAEKIKYDNILYASSSQVSAQQTFSADGAVDFKIGAYAAKGEFLDEFGDSLEDNDVVGLPDALYTTENPDLAAGQFAYITGGDITSYKSSASVTSTTATASQTAKIAEVTPHGDAKKEDDHPEEAEANFWGFSWQSNGDASAAARTATEIEGADDDSLTSVMYNAVAKSTSTGTASAVQDGIKVKGAEDFYAYAFSESGEGLYALDYADPFVDYTDADVWNLYADQETDLDNWGEGGMEITSYKSSASVSAKTATASQTLSTKGTVEDADFMGYGGKDIDTKADSEIEAENSLYLDDGKDLTYTATATGTSSGAASVTQELTSAKASDLDANVEVNNEVDDFFTLGAEQSAEVEAEEEDTFKVTSYKSSASINAKTAAASQSLSSTGYVEDADFEGFSGNFAEDKEFAAAESSLYIDDAKTLTYKATSIGTSNVAASVTQEVTSATAEDLYANVVADSNGLRARQSADVEADDELFQVKTYKSAASVDAKTAYASQSANLPSISDSEYEAKFCGSAGQLDTSLENIVYAQTAIDAYNAENVVYSANSASAQTVTATASQTFSASEVDGIIADALTYNDEFDMAPSGSPEEDGNFLDEFFANGPYLAAVQVAYLQGDDVKVTSYKSSASVNTKTASASQSAQTVGTLDAAFVGGSIQESGEYEFSAAVTGAVVEEGKDVSYDGKVTSASSVQATGSQTLTAKSATAIVQAAVAANQNGGRLQYAGSIDGAGDVYGQQITGYDISGGPIWVDSDNKVTSYSGSDRVSTTTTASGKVTTTATNTLNAQGGFLGRAIAAGEGNAITGGYVLEQLPLTLNPLFDENNLETATEYIIPVANHDANGVGVVGETLVFAPILSNDVVTGDPIIMDRQSDKPNQNSLSGTSTATVVNNMGTTTSTLSGSWKATARKDTTFPNPGDLNSIERFAYASNWDHSIPASGSTNTIGGALTISYNEKAKETDFAYPTASV